MTSYDCHRASRFRVFGSDAWAQLDPAFTSNGLQMIRQKSPTNSMAEDMTQVRMSEVITLPPVTQLDSTRGPAPQMLK